MSTFVITGGAGFIGSHLADALLSGGHCVRVVDDLSTGTLANLDRRCEFIHGDVSDPAVARSALTGVDGCFHLAAIASVERSTHDWLVSHRVNQSATVAVLDAARLCGGVPIVYASSAAIYGDLGGRTAEEDISPSPLTPYGVDKLGSEFQARVGFLVHGVPTFGFRLFNVYGSRQNPHSQYSGVISIFAARISRRQSVVLYGAGDQVRDFVHVSDVVLHLVAGMERLSSYPGAFVLNVCSGVGTSIVELAELIGAVSGCAALLSFAPRRVGDIRHSLGCPDRAIAALGVAARMSLLQGLKSTIGTAPLRPPLRQAG